MFTESMDAGITFRELLEFNARETARWKDWFAAHPEALDAKCDVAKAGTVRELLLHIFATELFFAHLVLDLPLPDWQKLPSQTIDGLFSVSDNARNKFHEFFVKSRPDDWNEVKDVGLGNRKASKRKMVAQAFLHGVHHRGQLATFLRQQAFDGMWVHDLILTDLMQ